MELIQNEFFVAEKYPVRPKRSKIEILTARAAKVGIEILRNNLAVIAVIADRFYPMQACIFFNRRAQISARNRKIFAIRNYSNRRRIPLYCPTDQTHLWSHFSIL